jgi:hypothetical protein
MIGVAINFWPSNVDQNMLQLGLLGQHDPGLVDHAKLMRKSVLFPLKHYQEWLGIFSSVLLTYTFFSHPSYFLKAKKDSSHSPEDLLSLVKMIRLRFYCGIALWVIPAMASIL